MPQQVPSLTSQITSVTNKRYVTDADLVTLTTATRFLGGYVSDQAFTENDMVTWQGHTYICNANIPFAESPDDDPGISTAWTPLTFPQITATYPGVLVDEALFGGLTTISSFYVRGVEMSAIVAPTVSAVTVDITIDGAEQTKIGTLAVSATYQQTIFGTALFVESGQLFRPKIKSVGSTGVGESPGQWLTVNYLVTGEPV